MNKDNTNKDIESRIRDLLNKYYSGETSTDENRQLKDFFREIDSSSLPPDLLADYEIFNLENEALEQVSVPEGFDSSVESFIESLPEKSKRVNPFTKIYLRIAVAAAVLVLFLIGWLMIDRKTHEELYSDEKHIENSEEIYNLHESVQQSREPEKLAGIIGSDKSEVVKKVRKSSGLLAYSNSSGSVIYDGDNYDMVKVMPEEEIEDFSDFENDLTIDLEARRVVITDPDEASRIVHQVFCALDDGLCRMNDTVVDKRYDNQVNTIDIGIISRKLNKFVAYAND